RRQQGHGLQRRKRPGGGAGLAGAGRRGVSDRAALYEVSVRSRARRSAPLPLGDLGDLLARILDGFSETSGSRVVRVLEVEREGDDLFAVVQHGAGGVAADIVDPTGTVRLRQVPEDVQLVRTGCLFRLPSGDTVGRLAVHVSNGRGVKELFGQGLAARIRSLRPEIVLAIERVGQPEALRAAVDAGRVERLRLVGGRAIAATDRWVPARAAGRGPPEWAPRGRRGPAVARR